MPETRGRKRKLSRDELTSVITEILKKRYQEQEKALVTPNEISAYLEIERDKIVHQKTIGRMGVSKDGFYPMNYPEICTYQQYGDNRLRGMIIKKDQWMTEVAE